MRGRRMLRAPATGALLVAVLAPAVAEAQLLPNLPARKRERIDCSQELPVYGLYRHKYYGYFPTCWRQFPPGWGCPSLESPDWEAELTRQPLDIPDEGADELGGPGGLGRDPFGGSGLDDLLPDLPGGRSPFDLDQPNGGSPFDAPRRSPSPFDAPGPGQGPGASPFDAPVPGRDAPGSGAPDRSSPPSPFDLPGASATPSELPSLAPPVSDARAPSEGEIAPSPVAPGISELAVIPDSRPRPVRLPVSATTPGIPEDGRAAPIGMAGPFDGAVPPPPVGMAGPFDGAVPPPPVGMAGPFDGAVPPPPVGMIPGDLPQAGPIGPIGGYPGVVHPGAHGVIISDPSYSGGEPIIMGPSDARPRRRFLSGLFGRGE